MKEYRISNMGNVDDIRCTLKHCSFTVNELTSEIDYEKQNKNCSSVINLLEMRIRKLNENKSK
ncbi:MAG: hypothetical protein BWX87_00683 [Bacteroidetes bacterium ADurb.Bin123]|jgi:hypothetical protein|nr:MAG: hypothetical protein BWX87_00683 [Bacteroidetes bacterium ADurb.Bin123]